MQSFQLHFSEIDHVLQPLGMRATVSVPNLDSEWSQKILCRLRGVLEQVDPAILQNASAVVLIDEPERAVACCVLHFLPLPDNAMEIVLEGVIPSHREMLKTLYLAAEESSRMVINRDMCIALNLLGEEEFSVWVPVSKADKRSYRERRRFLEALGYRDLMWESGTEFMYEKLLPLAHTSEAAFTPDGVQRRALDWEDLLRRPNTNGADFVLQSGFITGARSGVWHLRDDALDEDGVEPVE